MFDRAEILHLSFLPPSSPPALITSPLDRNQKVVAYASSGIGEYWILNIVDLRIEVLNNPDPEGQRYENEFHVEAGDSLSLPSGQVIAAADILPRY